MNLTPTMLVMSLFFSLIVPGLGFQQASKPQDLAGLAVPSSKVRVTEAMQSIIVTMQKVDKLPSCQKMASQSLLNSCSDLDHSTSSAADQGVDTALERSKSIYATRLAICELMDANAEIPTSCSLFKPADHISKGFRFRAFTSTDRPAKSASQEVYDHDTLQTLDKCSLALSSKPQWWTSYSNARQNAVLLCHSMRSELDKDDMVQKMKLMFDAVMEAASAMTDTTQEYREFEDSWRQMGKGMESFHVALNSDVETQKQIIEHWSDFRTSLKDLNGNIQDLGRDVDLVRQASSQINSDLDGYRLRTEAVQTDVTQKLQRVLEIAVQVDQSQASESLDASLSNFLLFNQYNQELAVSLAQNAENARALNQETSHLLSAISLVTENVTDAARTVSEFQQDINSLPTKLLHRVFESSIENLPFGLLSLVILSISWSLCFAVLDTWGPFRPRSTTVASLGLGVGFTFVFSELPEVSTLPCLNVLGVVLIALAAILSSKAWYMKQEARKQILLEHDDDPTLAKSSIC